MYRLFIIVVLLVNFILPSSQRTLSKPTHVNLTKCSPASSGGDVRVFITVSSLCISTTPEGIVRRHLEVNWLGRKPRSSDRVGVYDVDPKVRPSRPPLFSVDPSKHPAGYLRTTVELPFVYFNLSRLSQDPCVGYWAGYVDGNGQVLSSSCLQTRPFWMEENARFLQSQTLDEIMIPGSHDSGSFYFRREVAPLMKYKYAQEEPIFNQLVYGLRYFDLRVGFYNDTKAKFFINHNFLRTDHSVESVLQQVLEFVEATREVVILDFHNFPIGFHSAKPHLELMRMIVEKFGTLLVPFEEPDERATLGYLWRKNKRVLVSYNSQYRSLTKGNLLWPGLARAWGNKQHPKDLKEYFQEVFSRKLPRGLWASMAELTPNTRTIILHPDTGLRVFADEINRNVTRWFRDLFWQKANIVATDYFLGNNMIDVAIETNAVKAHCPRKYWT